MKRVRLFAHSEIWIAVLVLLSIGISSCAFKEQPVLMKSAGLPFAGNICRIAVLPFTNQTDYQMAETIFTRVFVGELIAAGNFVVAQEGDVRLILNQMRIIPGEELSSEQLRALADRLGVQIVISGSVLEMRDKIGRVEKLDPSLAVIVRIMEASSGRTIWATYNRGEGRDYQIIMHFGLLNTVSALAEKVSAEIIDMWFKEGLKKCTE